MEDLILRSIYILEIFPILVHLVKSSGYQRGCFFKLGSRQSMPQEYVMKKLGLDFSSGFAKGMKALFKPDDWQAALGVCVCVSHQL